MTKKYCSGCGLELPQDAETPYTCPMCGSSTVTTTPPIPKQIKGDRPQAVTVISVISIIGGLMAAIFGLIVVALFSSGAHMFGGWRGMFLGYLSLIGVFLFFGGFFSLFVGWGLWKGAEWAWTLGAILEILGIIGGIMTIPFGLISVLVCGPILYYLFRPNVKAWFRKTVVADRLMDTCGLPVSSQLCRKRQKTPLGSEG